MNRTPAILIVFILFAFYATAQELKRCSAVEYLNLLELRDPAYRKKREKSDTAYAGWIAANAGENRRSVVTIPVVFHMLYHDTSQYLDDSVVLSQLDVINEDYRRRNIDSGQTPLAFRAAAADCEIEFCLAKRTPAGVATTGIIHKYTNDSVFNSFDDPKLSSSGGSDAWDPSKYLNIWVAAFANPNFLGLGTFPGGNPQYDGVVINYKTCGRIGSHLLPHYNKGRTLTHEIGHWLNLQHVWGDDGNTCNADDNVSDTPLQSAENYGCPGYPKTDNCSSSFPGIMFMNFLDYTDDECMNIFTEGQKSRMLAALNVDRASLLTSIGCTPVGIEENDLSNFFSVYPNPATDKLVIKLNSGQQGNIWISVTGMLGETALPAREFSGQSLDVSMLAPGIYFLRIITENGIGIFKLIKE